MLWGGRFKEKLDTNALLFSTSIGFDKKLFEEDIQVSLAHTAMLKKTGLIDTNEAEEITEGLKKIRAEYTSGAWAPDESQFEDIHSAVESRLTEHIGETAGKLHTGRSRNDQVATGMRLWIKKSCAALMNDLKKLQYAVVRSADENQNIIMPGYTHMQRAQPVSFAFHMLAYTEMLERDIQRIEFVYKEADSSPLGSGALAGSTLPLDSRYSADQMGFANLTDNALDAVSDRDYMLDFLNSCALGMMHLSRLSEELVLWSTAEWNFVTLSDSFTTGSSLMPQKKNPDMAELIRGKVGRVYGNYISLATTMKGLPLSYNRDMQEDKEPVFDSFETYSSSLNIMASMISTMLVKKDRFTEDLKSGYTLATDLADWLVLKGVPFREAHKLVGLLIKYAESKNVAPGQLTLEEFQSVSPIFDDKALQILSMQDALFRKKTHGSTNPGLICQSIKKWKTRLEID
ncbi:MAG: argininosuccinate lyase [Bacteroidota bacterium]